jgi:hypothetical protein
MPRRAPMYTLILVIYFSTGQGNGGTAVATQTVQGFSSEASCAQEAQKNTAKLTTNLRSKDYSSPTMPSEVRWSCFKIN